MSKVLIIEARKEVLKGSKEQNRHSFTHQMNIIIITSRFIEQIMWKLGMGLPIINAVIFTNASSILEEMPEEFHIFKLPSLRLKLRQWFNDYPIQINESMLDLIKQKFYCEGSTSARRYLIPKDVWRKFSIFRWNEHFKRNEEAFQYDKHTTIPSI